MVSSQGASKKQKQAGSFPGKRRNQRFDRVTRRFQVIYLTVMAVAIALILVFSLLIRGRLSDMLGTGEERSRPEFDVFPYHSLTDQRGHGGEEGEPPVEPDESAGETEAWAQDESLGNLPPLPRVPAPPPQSPGTVTEATAETSPLTDNGGGGDQSEGEGGDDPSATEEPPVTETETDESETSQTTGGGEEPPATSESSQGPEQTGAGDPPGSDGDED